jgi:hypothetical protein
LAQPKPFPRGVAVRNARRFRQIFINGPTAGPFLLAF